MHYCEYICTKELESFFHAEGNGLAQEKIKCDGYLVCTYTMALSHLHMFFMHTQRISEVLNVKALTDDELIECHLKTLAKWTVHNYINYV